MTSSKCRREVSYFYPRPLRGGRRKTLTPGMIRELFLSTPSARRATILKSNGSVTRKISIHALCEEGDLHLRRHSQRGRISIHALCEEGDPACMPCPLSRTDFYPRPLRGGRRSRRSRRARP